jgi:spermidine synthase
MAAGSAPASAGAGGEASPGFLWHIYVNAFVVGAVVMGFEMLGSRYLNPFFGSGIYTWAALISTVLAALTAGYFFGGWMADRRPTPTGLGWLIVAGSVYLAAIPLFAVPLLSELFDAIDSERWGSLAGAMALLFVPLALLGVYSPYAIRLTLSATARSGTVAGRIYGISTLGSIFGTLFVTFYLIPLMGSRHITYLLSAIGVAAGLSFVLAYSPRRARAVALAASAAAALALAPMPPAAAETPRDNVYIEDKPDPIYPTLIRAQVETEYNNIFIVQKGDFLSMTFRLKGENVRQSALNLRDRGQLPLVHSQYQTLGAVHAGKLRTMLMVGLGGGSVSDYFLRHVPDIQVTSVELDPGVVEAAKKYFGVAESPRHRIATGDGRVFLMRNKVKYDLVMIDAFRGGYVPFHLLTIEFYQLLATRMEPDGVAILNLRANSQLFESSLATLRRIFKTIEVYEWGGNAIVLTRHLPPLPAEAKLAMARERQAQFKFRYDLVSLLKDEVKREPAADARVLTDDFAPVNLYDSIDVGRTRKK